MRQGAGKAITLSRYSINTNFPHPDMAVLQAQGTHLPGTEVDDSLEQKRRANTENACRRLLMRNAGIREGEYTASSR